MLVVPPVTLELSRPQEDPMFRQSQAALLAASLSLFAFACNQKDHDRSPSSKAADNTGINSRDRAESAVMPTDQKENDTDLRIAQTLRASIVNDDTLSFNAKNIKLVSSGGVVTLRGPVKDDSERLAIETKARAIEGVVKVDNQLELTH
jgi:osmotically-inducible protein OsmY